MHDVNWWLMALAFLARTCCSRFAFMIRRVTREVPIYAALGRGPKVEVKKPDVEVRKPDVETEADRGKWRPVVDRCGRCGGGQARQR